MEHDAVLMHLHGSVRFGFRPNAATNEIVKYASGTEALQSVIYPPPAMPPRPAPIISGQRKDRWMTTACVPFGYYHSSFVNTVCECPRILIAGYGGRDRHINAWIYEHRRIHGDAHRLAWIDPKVPECLAAPIPHHWLVLRSSDGKFPPANPDLIQRVINHLRG
jgi:hypothetical protein